MIARQFSNRIVIVGGGIAGLSIAGRLAQAGLPVTVLEASRLGEAATTRNQGWLHSGAWFAPQQLELARRCYESFQQTLRFSPECVAADPAPMVYLVSRGETDPEPLMAAWEAAGIPYQRLTPERLFERLPGLAISQAHHAFELPDRSMRTDLLLRRLAEAAQRAGAEIRAGSPVVRLMRRGECVQGVELSSGEKISARMVILAGNARGGALLPGFGTRAVGPEPKMALLVLKMHLAAVRPQLSPWPWCVVDAEGLNHLPHHPMSVFGTNRWLPAGHGEDERTMASEFQTIWNHLQRLFPDFKRVEHQVTEWAGTTAGALPLDQLEAGQVPLPVVVDHERESDRAENLLSVFPGRASLWAHLAEEATARVLEKLGQGSLDVARPPWDLAGKPRRSLRGCELIRED